MLGLFFVLPIRDNPHISYFVGSRTLGYGGFWPLINKIAL